MTIAGGSRYRRVHTCGFPSDDPAAGQVHGDQFILARFSKRFQLRDGRILIVDRASPHRRAIGKDFENIVVGAQI
ncbi:MAG TPA: hypothetical protein VJR26_02955 [Candidatus Acidoferrales bacterium]|nr:hypothetical protein [Candidatus Acidoferrales bacterium]